MLRIEPVESIIEKMGAHFVDSTLIHEDYQRLVNCHYGKSCNPLMFNEKLLFLGARSGLEILLAKKANPEAIIDVIESNPLLRGKISEIPLNHINVFASFNEYIAGTPAQSYDFVRIDRANFSLTFLTELFSRHDISSICGELNEIDCRPLTLYRMSRENCDSFFFNIKGKNYNVAGSRKKSQQPEVTVVVAAYGVEAYLDECIASIVHQSLKNIEILIIDDGSVDETGRKADEWENRFPDVIRVIHKKNGGCASARLEGLKEAKGEYVAFVDGDDWVEQPMYEDLFESAALHNAEIAQCGFYEFYADQTKNYYPTSWGADGQNGTSGLVRDTTEYLTLMPSIWRRIYKTSFLKKHKIEFPVQIRRHDDLPFAFMTIARAKRISVIPDCYYAYRLNRPGQDVGATDERLFIHFEIFEWLYEQVRPWASMAIMSNMRLVEIGTHSWVLGRLDRDLKNEYLHKAIEGVRERYKNYDLNDGWIERMNLASQ
ncbi:hypothetical protein C5Y41_09590 [Rahnella variigena]|uniref:glycosyltransferase n=1 Tax=Rahnella variigena TaxID=574964 RepID=UPI00101C3FEE|nr:glycosyltransferase [Rahnella variigena]RYJ17465.1 hypothetical protein C5Y41_09590 [Rahnella variigena]